MAEALGIDRTSLEVGPPPDRRRPERIAPPLSRLDALVDGLDDARAVVSSCLADAAATYRETRPNRDD